MYSTSDDLINRPEVDALVRGVLRRMRLPSDGMEDAIQEVKTRALEVTMHDRPDSLDRWQKVCWAVAKAYGVDTVRQQCARRKVNVGLTEDADDALLPPGPDAAESIDIRRKLDALRDLHTAGRLDARTLEILDAVQAGVSGPKIAEELGVSYRWLRTYLETMRARMDATLLQRGLAVAFIIWFIVCARRAHVVEGTPTVLDPPRASHQNDVGGETRPVLPFTFPPAEDTKTEDAAATREAHDRAAALVVKARAEVSKKNWRQCSTDIEEAMKLDPSLGKEAEDIQTMCAQERMRESESKGPRR